MILMGNHAPFGRPGRSGGINKKCNVLGLSLRYQLVKSVGFFAVSDASQILYRVFNQVRDSGNGRVATMALKYTIDFDNNMRCSNRNFELPDCSLLNEFGLLDARC